MSIAVWQAPEDGTDVVTAAKRVITEPGLNTLGLKDKRDIIRLVAQSALQVGPPHPVLIGFGQNKFI